MAKSKRFDHPIAQELRSKIIEILILKKRVTPEELAKAASISRASVTNHLKYLLQCGVIDINSAESNGVGRRHSTITLRGGRRVAIIALLSPDKVYGQAIGYNHEVIYTQEETVKEPTQKAVINTLWTVLDNMARHLFHAGWNLEAVGIPTAGILAKPYMVVKLDGIEDWTPFAVVGAVSGRLRIKCIMWTDVYAALDGYYKINEISEEENVDYFQFLPEYRFAGRKLTGTTFGEVGTISPIDHCPIDPEGEFCFCGQVGCLHTVLDKISDRSSPEAVAAVMKALKVMSEYHGYGRLVISGLDNSDKAKMTVKKHWFLEKPPVFLTDKQREEAIISGASFLIVKAVLDEKIAPS